MKAKAPSGVAPGFLTLSHRVFKKVFAKNQNARNTPWSFRLEELADKGLKDSGMHPVGMVERVMLVMMQHSI